MNPGRADQQLKEVADQLEARFPKSAALLREAAEDVLAYRNFPPAHRRRIHSTNPLERLNREVARRCDMVGIFPNVQAAIRLLDAIREEQQDEWIAGRCYFSTESMAELYEAIRTEQEQPNETAISAEKVVA